MLTCLAFCAHDTHLAKSLLRWICELGGCKNHKVLLLADCNQPWVSALEIHQLAGEAFGNATLITTEEHYEGWPEASNWMWYCCAEHVSKYHKEPFLWLEPDAVPLKPGWLNKIAGEYQGGYLGHIYKFDNPNGPFAPIDVMSGIAVYPEYAFSQIGGIIKARPKHAWDVSGCGPMTKYGSHTNLVHHFFGQKGLPPTFVSAKVNGSPVNAKAVSEIPSEAVLFHRNKDGSLIHLLREQQGGINRGRHLMLLFSFCGRDYRLAIKNLNWMARLNGQNNSIVLHTDQSVSDSEFAAAIQAARLSFRNVTPSRLPKQTQSGWPQGPNAMFQTGARLMATWNRPWIWCEPDAVFVRPDWLQQLTDEYWRHGKPFMGHLVGGMGHMNGVGVYPPNLSKHAPSAMTCTTTPFDMAMQFEIAPHVHRANHLIQHCRAAANGRCLDQHGAPPIFRSHADLTMVEPSTVMFHPSKDGSLIDRLMERNRIMRAGA